MKLTKFPSRARQLRSRVYRTCVSHTCRMTAQSSPNSNLRPDVVLIIDDEPPIRRAVANALRPLGTRVIEAATGAEGIDTAATARPDLVVLDLGLPDMPGQEVCLEIRRWSSVPIIVLSARLSADEKVALLLAGADDYLTKPFSMPELLARMQAVLRRARPDAAAAERVIESDGLSIDMVWREVRRDGQVIRLTPTEWRLLHALASHPGRTLTHQQIFDGVWAKAFGVPQHYLRVHVTNLRRKIERDPTAPLLIVTEPGVGYRFQAEGS